MNYMKGDLLNFGEQPAINRWVKQVQDGREMNLIAPFQENDEERMLIVGFPLRYGKVIEAAAFVYTPVSNIQSLTGRIDRILVLVSLGITVPVGFILFFVSRRFVRPFKDMRQAAASIAEGNFSERVLYKENDELGDLASSFNGMAEKLERVETSRRQFISEISHELRTPLTTVRASLQGLADGILSEEEEREFTQIALKETRRMSQLIEDLLQLSAFEESHVQLNKERTDLAALVRETVQQMRSRFDEKTMEVRTDVAGGAFADVDPDRIRQVLLNLLDNAVKHNPPGTKVCVTLADRADAWHIAVCDNGPGVPADVADKLFDRLYKADSSRHTQGAGLGLTIAKYIVEAHGGTISVESEIGEGTCFRVTLPSS
ncbi:sensor histidine kinase [Gordoniibacillus kamchatkensis]|uniref:sensor histidine kinase n=1 Tax=Gordoniibacillus kamchatkensis TaxID=1590651 RepID=UPI000698BEBE|nr:HAMP domain-containing sensor histidine kinase [Paenibacillus sp. VKM B-2647]